MPPVSVNNWPGPDFAAWLTFAIGLVTLAAVGYQIRLARKALKATNDTLDLAREELTATKETLDATRNSNELVQESLRYAREQSDVLARRATLWLFSAFDIAGLAAPFGQPANIHRRTFHVANYLTDGKGKSAHGASIVLLFPPGIVPSFESVEIRDQFGWQQIADWDDGGVRWQQWQGTLSDAFFPGALKAVFRLGLRHIGHVQHTMRWRLVYDDGLTPADGTFLPLTSDVDPTRLAAGVPSDILG